MKKFLVLPALCVGVLLSANMTFGAGLNQIEKSIFELEYFGMQLQTVEIEMSLWLAQEDKDSPNYNKGASVRHADLAVDELALIKSNLVATTLPQELEELRPQLLMLVDSLSNIYIAVAQEKKPDLDVEFKKFWNRVAEYNKSLKAKIDLYLNVPKLTEKVDLTAIEAELFATPEDKSLFKTADKLFVEKKYDEAAGILKDLLPKNRDTLAEGSIVSRLVDCSIMGDLAEEDVGPRYDARKVLSKFVDKQKYSPRLNRIFLQWRSLTQIEEYGLSNWSQIPNDRYSKVLWELAGVVEQYIERNPDDMWARIELMLLMDTPLIERWRSDYPYGSSVAIDHYNLFGI